MPVTDRYDLTAKERVQGFITAFESYKHDCDLQPLPDESRFEFFTSEDQARSMRIRTHRAIALRKFVLQHKDAFYLVKLLEDAQWDGMRHFDAHAYRTEDADGVWDFARGCIRNYLAFAAKAREFDQDPRVAEALAYTGVPALAEPTVGLG